MEINFCYALLTKGLVIEEIHSENYSAGIFVKPCDNLIIFLPQLKSI